VNLKELLAVHRRFDELAAEIAALKARLVAVEAPKARGGDPRAAARGARAVRDDARAVRDEALQQLAGLLGGDLSLAAQAREIRRKATRYRPALGDESGKPERRALHRLAETGLGVPGRKQVERIIRAARPDADS
jgi:hypothetical protein